MCSSRPSPRISGWPGRGSSDDQLENKRWWAVDARDWVEALPEKAWRPWSEPGAVATPAQAQQVALARLVLADPHTLVPGRGDVGSSTPPPRRGTSSARLASGPTGPNGGRDRPPSSYR